MNSESITAGISIATALGTIAVVVPAIIALRKTRLTTSAELVLELHARYRNLKTERAELSQWLLDARKHEKDSDLSDRDDSILEFFEIIALLYNKGVLDKDMTWCLFSWEIERYHMALTDTHDLLRALRRKERAEALFTGFEKLANDFKKTNKNEGGQREIKEEDVVKFLKFEASLRSPASGRQPNPVLNNTQPENAQAVVTVPPAPEGGEASGDVSFGQVPPPGRVHPSL